MFVFPCLSNQFQCVEQRQKAVLWITLTGTWLRLSVHVDMVYRTWPGTLIKVINTFANFNIFGGNRKFKFLANISGYTVRGYMYLLTLSKKGKERTLYGEKICALNFCGWEKLQKHSTVKTFQYIVHVYTMSLFVFKTSILSNIVQACKQFSCYPYSCWLIIMAVLISFWLFPKGMLLSRVSISIV